MIVSVQDLCDPSQCSPEEAIRIARQRSGERQAYDLEVAQYLHELWGAAHIDAKAVERTLILLAEIAPPPRLFAVLRSAMVHHDPHVRSKAAVALARHVESGTWLGKLTADDDPRVRANTIEALWGRTSPETEALFLENLSDPHHRVAANALYGLHLIDPTKHRVALEVLISHPQPRYRSAAAWVIGKIGDPDLIPLLKSLMFDKVAEVKRAAFRSLSLLRTAKETAAESGRDPDLRSDLKSALREDAA